MTDEQEPKPDLAALVAAMVDRLRRDGTPRIAVGEHGFNIALDQHNADGIWNLPVPAAFVINQEQVVRARHGDPNYRDRMRVDDILSALDDITARQP
jgi:hypothetical protein